MTKNTLVRMLVSVPDEASFDSCTLCFETLRVGFPTAEIRVEINYHPKGDPEQERRAAEKALFVGRVDKIVRRDTPIHHGDWVNQAIYHHRDSRPLFIVDPDTIFWKSCEDWSFPDRTLLAGYYVPRIWNDFAKCISMARIHTSMMIFPDVARLRDKIDEIYPYSREDVGEYCPCNPFKTSVQFVGGVPHYWDGCANLYQMLTSSASYPGAVAHLGIQHLECFDHLNSASSYNVMTKRMDDPSGFHYTHRHIVKDRSLYSQPWPMGLKNTWRPVGLYYQQKEIEGRLSRP